MNRKKDVFQEAGFDLASLGEEAWWEKFNMCIWGTQRRHRPATPGVMLSYPKHSLSIHNPEKSVLPQILLGLVPPAHPRFNAERLSRPIFVRWVSETRLRQKHYMKLYPRQNMLKEHPSTECLLWHLCSRGIKIPKLHPLEKSNHISNCSSAAGYVSSQFPSCAAELVLSHKSQILLEEPSSFLFSLCHLISVVFLAFRCCRNPWLAPHSLINLKFTWNLPDYRNTYSKMLHKR